MENLNDAEFGSDKDTEEAPILIAQRHLNIFRQIHIFSAEKRQQFDDELLALPQNVFEFFKKMPGGRLLVEHIEEVKTERGIDFVKSSREEFTNDIPTDAPAASAAPVVGGTVAIDASFAETLGNTLASAFKHSPIPSAPSVGGANGGAVSADLSRLITEELSLSRTSLTELLKEIRSITDSVIASQILLAKSLGQLSSQPSTQVPSNANTDVDYKLNKFRSEINSKLEELTSSIQEQRNFTPKLFAHGSTSQYENSVQVENIPQNDFSQEDGNPFKKKKKKKKNRDNSLSQVAESFLSSPIDEPISNDLGGSDYSREESAFDELAPALGNVVKDVTSKPQNDFTPSSFNASFDNEDISLDVGQNGLDDLDFTLPEQEINSYEEHAVESNVVPNKVGDGLDFALPEQGIAVNEDSDDEITTPNENLNHLDELVGDGLDFGLPEQGSALEDNEEDTAPQGDINHLDNLVGNDLDFTLPEQGIAVKDEDEIESTPLTQTDDELTDLIGGELSFEEEPAPNPVVEEPVTALAEDDLSGLDDLISEGLSLEEEPAPNPVVEEPVTALAEDDFGGLDDLISEGLSLEEDPTQNPVADEPVARPTETDLSRLDDLLSGGSIDTQSLPSEDFNSAAVEEKAPRIEQPQQSRYSAELDRIRAALTTDNVDISSLDEPIALDDYSDDENVNGVDELAALINEDNTQTQSAPQSLDITSSQDVEEWVYVDENGNPISQADDENWEWEYVDENGNPVSESSEGGDEDWEWEYVEDNEGNDNQTDNNNK